MPPLSCPVLLGVPLHFGSLHAYEQWLAITLAFAPFVVLGIVIAVRRRQDAALERDEAAPPSAADLPAGGQSDPASQT